MKRLMVLLFCLLLLGCASSTTPADQTIKSIPDVAITIEDETYTFTHGSYYLETKGRVEQTDAASPNQIAEELEPIFASSFSKVTIDLEGDPNLSVYEWDENERLHEITLEKNSFSLSKEQKKTIYEVCSEWPNAEASYTFVVHAKDS